MIDVRFVSARLRRRINHPLQFLAVLIRVIGEFQIPGVVGCLRLALVTGHDLGRRGNAQLAEFPAEAFKSGLLELLDRLLAVSEFAADVLKLALCKVATDGNLHLRGEFVNRGVDQPAAFQAGGGIHRGGRAGIRREVSPGVGRIISDRCVEGLREPVPAGGFVTVKAAECIAHGNAGQCGPWFSAARIECPGCFRQGNARRLLDLVGVHTGNVVVAGGDPHRLWQLVLEPGKSAFLGIAGGLWLILRDVFEVEYFLIRIDPFEAGGNLLGLLGGVFRFGLGNKFSFEIPDFLHNRIIFLLAFPLRGHLDLHRLDVLHEVFALFAKLGHFAFVAGGKVADALDHPIVGVP